MPAAADLRNLWLNEAFFAGQGISACGQGDAHARGKPPAEQADPHAAAEHPVLRGGERHAAQRAFAWLLLPLSRLKNSEIGIGRRSAGVAYPFVSIAICKFRSKSSVNGYSALLASLNLKEHMSPDVLHTTHIRR